MNYYLHLNKKEYMERMQDVKDFFPQLIEDESILQPMKATLKAFLNATMQAEMKSYLNADTYQHTHKRTGYRNGSYQRNLVTKFGLISMLEVPRCRKGKFETKVFRHYRRRWQTVDNFIKEVFIAGVSTRETGLVLEKLLDTRPSHSTVSEISKIIDDELKKFRKRPLTDEYVYLFLDGITVKVSGCKVRTKVMLVAYGIKENGKREVIGFRLANSESSQEWEVFLWSLYRRGLVGDKLRLIITDGGKGLIKAVRSVYPEVPYQRCWVHKLRNLGQKLPRRYKEQCLKGARKIYLAGSYRKAYDEFKQWSKQWRRRLPGVVKSLEDDIEELLRFLKEPAWLHSKVRTTNAIERLFREVRKRIRPMCSFANNESCERIIYGVISKYNKLWENKPLWKANQFTQNS